MKGIILADGRHILAHVFQTLYFSKRTAVPRGCGRTFVCRLLLAVRRFADEARNSLLI